tara:strand:- start:2166 stop:2495 length:330 start_codon:yes stop_codon:yes gene_type:complete
MPFYPYWSVYDGLGQKYCDCSHEKYAITTLQLHEGEGFTYRRVDAPKPLPPEIIDVDAQKDKELPGQQGLPSATERLHEDMRKAIIDAAVNGYEKVLEKSDSQKLDDLH